MSGLTVQDIYDFVWTHLDVDDSDLPESLLDHWMKDAHIRIISFFDESPTWLQEEYTFSTAVDVQGYDLDDIGTIPLHVVDEIRSPNFSLTPRSHRQVREQYRVDAPSGRPQEFSQWGRTIYLWPKPSSIEVFYILGIRNPDYSWVGEVAEEPDLPEEFHQLIAQWTLSRAYAQQDDPEMANFFREEFARELKNVASRWMSNLTALPLIMNGGRRHEAYRTQRNLGALIYDWE